MIIRRPAKGKGIARKIKRSKWKKGRVLGKARASSSKTQAFHAAPITQPVKFGA